MTIPKSRDERAAELPIVGGLPSAPGIVAAMKLSPSLELHLRGLADALLVEPFRDSSLERAERELLATTVSSYNQCYYCMDSHGVFAAIQLERAGIDTASAASTVEEAKSGDYSRMTPKMASLGRLSRAIAGGAFGADRQMVERCLENGANDSDVQLAILIGAGFSMYNRLVDGFRSATPNSTEVYRPRGEEIADNGYSTSRVSLAEAPVTQADN